MFSMVMFNKLLQFNIFLSRVRVVQPIQTSFSGICGRGNNILISIQI